MSSIFQYLQRLCYSVVFLDGLEANQTCVHAATAFVGLKPIFCRPVMKIIISIADFNECLRFKFSSIL